MQYTFYRWRARKTGSTDWRELGWCMTEEDAKIWAEQNGHQIERIAEQAEHRVNAGRQSA